VCARVCAHARVCVCANWPFALIDFNWSVLSDVVVIVAVVLFVI